MKARYISLYERNYAYADPAPKSTANELEKHLTVRKPTESCRSTNSDIVVFRFPAFCGNRSERNVYI